MLGCPVLVGELLTNEALSGGKRLVRSEAIRGGTTTCIPSNLTRGESIVNGDSNWDGDIGASSKPKQKVSMHDRQTVVLSGGPWLGGRERQRTWSKHIREPLHALDPPSDPPDIDKSQYNCQSNDPAHCATRYRQDGHGGRRACGSGGTGTGTRSRNRSWGTAQAVS